MTTEYERVIEEARRLGDAVIAAKSLRAVFLRYAFIHAILTGIVAVALIVGFYFFYVRNAPDAREDRIVEVTQDTSNKLERLAQENHEILLTLRCLLLTPDNKETEDTTRDCSSSPNREEQFGSSESKGGGNSQESDDSPQ